MSADSKQRENKLKTVGTLAAGIAHELGTPLNIVSGRAEMILAQDLESLDVKNCARIIKDQSQRMTGIIRQLLDFSRITPSQKLRVELWTLVRQTRDLFSPLARSKNIEMDLPEIQEEKYCEVDPSKIQQVFMNLIMNSIQAKPDGGKIRIRIESACLAEDQVKLPGSNDFHIIEIKDSGIGIDKDSLLHLFEPFYTTKEIGEGTGLGLSIVYGILREHSGWIEIDSGQWQGTCCRVYLPN